MKDFGQYVADCLPKYIQRVQVTNHEELELLIHPEGVIPVASFLKDHHNAQYLNIIDIAGVDIPSRENRFEVLSVFSYSVYASKKSQLYSSCF